MPVVGKDANIMPYDNAVLGDVLNTVLSAGKNKIQDKMWRESLKKSLGITSDAHTLKEMIDLDKKRVEESFKAKEWKPQTLDEAIALAGAKSKAKKDESKTYEEDLKTAIANGDQLTKEQVNYYNRFLKKSNEDALEYVDPEVAAQAAAAEANKYPKNIKSWDDVNFGNKLRSAFGLTSSPEEKILGALRPGGTLWPPKVTAPVAPVSAAPVVSPVAPAAAPVAPEEEAPDPIAERIKEVIAAGMDPKEVAQQLKEKGIDPSTYGL